MRMIRWSLVAGGAIAGVAFAAGAWVGWKTTLKVIDSVEQRRKKVQDVR